MTQTAGALQRPWQAYFTCEPGSPSMLLLGAVTVVASVSRSLSSDRRFNLPLHLEALRAFLGIRAAVASTGISIARRLRSIRLAFRLELCLSLLLLRTYCANTA